MRVAGRGESHTSFFCLNRSPLQFLGNQGNITDVLLHRNGRKHAQEIAEWQGNEETAIGHRSSNTRIGYQRRTPQMELTTTHRTCSPLVPGPQGVLGKPAIEVLPNVLVEFIRPLADAGYGVESHT